MKDEFVGVIIIEFVGLKSKMNSIKKNDCQEHNTAKGVSIAIELINLLMFDLIKKLLDIK